MCNHSKKYPELPRDTAQVGKAVVITYLNRTIGDNLDSLLGGINLTGLGISWGKSASSLSLLALVTVLQYIEVLPDNQAAEAVRTRMDWKYALHLPLDFPGIEPRILCEFRSTLLFSADGQTVFQLLLNRFAEAGLLPGCSSKPVSAIEVLIAVCSLSRLDNLLDTMRCTIEVLAAEHTEWLRINSLPHWFRRYKHEPDPDPISNLKDKQAALANSIGKDISHLLTAIEQIHQTEITALPEVTKLKKVWYEQYEVVGGKLMWRSLICASCSGDF
jgi:transposase